MKASLTALLACAMGVDAFGFGSMGVDAFGFGFKPLPPPVPHQEDGLDQPEQELARNVKAGEFQQLVDHANPALGTFRQRYWWSAEFYGGPGSPVVFFTPGEADATNYTKYATNATITGLFAQAVGGGLVVMEHRFFGESSPFTVLSTANMTHLTLNNSIKDVTYFAKNVRLPFDPDGTSTPDKAPWIMSGGSYSGALAAWISRLDPGVIWAYHASSAPVQAMANFWHYYDPIRDGAMPRNCSADVVRLADHIDQVLGKGTDLQRQALKDKMGMGSLPDGSIYDLLNYPMFAWQRTLFNNSTDKVEFPKLNFGTFCDYVEGMWNGSANADPGPEGVGLERAVDGYAMWVRHFLVDQNYCQARYHYDDFAAPNNLSCFKYNATGPLLTDLSLNNTADRQWTWLVCNEAFGWYPVAPPQGTPSIVSRIFTVDSYMSRCASMFPPGPNNETFGLATGKTADATNALTGGWDDYWANTTRIIWANGLLDPWRAATVSSDQRPGGPLPSTAQVPVNIIKGGIHCSDLLTENGKNNPDVQKVMDEEMAVIKAWRY